MFTKLMVLYINFPAVKLVVIEVLTYEPNCLALEEVHARKGSNLRRIKSKPLNGDFSNRLHRNFIFNMTLCGCINVKDQNKILIRFYIPLNTLLIESNNLFTKFCN